MLSPIIVATCLGEVFIKPTAEAECVSDQFNRGQDGQIREYTAAMICLAQRPQDDRPRPMQAENRVRDSSSGNRIYIQVEQQNSMCKLVELMYCKLAAHWAEGSKVT